MLRWPATIPITLLRARRLVAPPARPAAKVYLAGENENLWAAAMICPFGYGEVIELNLLRQTQPCWNVQEHSDGAIFAEWREFVL